MPTSTHQSESLICSPAGVGGGWELRLGLWSDPRERTGVGSVNTAYIMLRRYFQGEDITVVNIYAPNIGGHQYIRQMITAIKGEIGNNTIIVGDFNTPLSPMDRSSEMKINKEAKALNDIKEDGLN